MLHCSALWCNHLCAFQLNCSDVHSLPSVQIYAGPLAGGARAVVMLNLHHTGGQYLQSNITVGWALPECSQSCAAKHTPSESAGPWGLLGSSKPLHRKRGSPASPSLSLLSSLRRCTGGRLACRLGLLPLCATCTLSATWAPSPTHSAPLSPHMMWWVQQRLAVWRGALLVGWTHGAIRRLNCTAPVPCCATCSSDMLANSAC